MRIGIGYDVHRLVENRKLVIGGTEIPWSKGLLGHSDADVLIHACIDAILGAAHLGDIGSHFPDSDEAYKDISSVELLEKVAKLLGNEGYKITNLDAIIIAQEPKMFNYILSMRENIAIALDTSFDNVNIKATTTEGLGSIGKGEGIAAQAVALIDAK